MASTRSLEDFDRAVRTILEQEFVGVVEMGLMPEEVLLPVVAGMRTSLREAYAAMSVNEVESHLQFLRDECRDTARSLFALADNVDWN